MNAAATGEDLRVCRTADDQWKLTSSGEHLPSASYCTANQLLTGSSVEDKLNMMAIIKKDLDEQPSQVVLWTVGEEGTKQPYDIHDSYGEYSSWEGYARHSNDLKWIHADMKMEIASKPKLSPDELPCDRRVRAFIEYMTEEVMKDDYKEGVYDNQVVKLHMEATVIQKFLYQMNEMGGLTRAQFDRVNETVIGHFNERSAGHQMELALGRALDHGVVSLREQEEDVDELWDDYVADHEANCDHSLEQEQQDFINLMTGQQQQQQDLLDLTTKTSAESS